MSKTYKGHNGVLKINDKEAQIINTPPSCLFKPTMDFENFGDYLGQNLKSEGVIKFACHFIKHDDELDLPLNEVLYDWMEKAVINFYKINWMDDTPINSFLSNRLFRLIDKLVCEKLEGVWNT